MSTILLTEGNRGLGRVTAEKLAARGHAVVLTARDQAKGAAAAAEIRRAVPGARVEAMVVDLASLASVRAFSEAVLARGEPLDVLFHCAGVMQQSPTRRLTRDGFEETLAVNALAPFLLTSLLLPLLSRAPAARVVCVSSRMHLPGGRGAEVAFDFADPHLARNYDHDRAYKNSKLALLWFTYELARRLPPLPITANAVCPGFVPVTGAESTQGMLRFMMRWVLPHLPFARSVAEATDSLVWMATAPSLAGVTGKFFGEMKEIASSEESRDPDEARRFWALARELTGLAEWPA
jgi:NAD(P)-dependent dehydrogenase (short-subunit alcohol dehydrogenase family)